MTMPDSKPAVPLTSSVDTEAARWFARMNSDARTDDDARHFQRWLNADLRHRRAYQRLSEQWMEYSAFADSPEVQRARSEALARGAVAPFGRARRLVTRAALPVAAAVAAAFVIAAIIGTDRAEGPSTYQTGIGERQTITLADGSVFHLNTSTRLRVAFSDVERRAVLEKGQAYFEVAPDVRRPFRVSAGSTVVTALGTAFDIRRSEHEVVVTLVEGRVEVAGDVDGAPVKAQPPPPEPLRLEAGQQVAFVESAGFSGVRPADIEATTAWLDGRLVFEDRPLEQALAEVNRYSTQTVRIGDDRLRELRISGVFRTGSTETVIEALRDYFGIRAVTEADGTTTLLPGDGEPPFRGE